MKNAAKVFYMIGIVLCAIGIFFYIFAAVVLAASTSELIGEIIEELPKTGYGSILRTAVSGNPETMRLTLVIAMAVLAVMDIAVLIVSIVARNNLDKEKPSLAPHITMIVIGICGGSLLSTLGGIFATIGVNTDRNRSEGER